MNIILTIAVCVCLVVPIAAAPTEVLNVWPKDPPGELLKLPPEQDTTKDDGRMVGGKRVIRLGNVATPQLHVYLPPKEKRNGTGVVICPGGGFNILAWDLEGTEVAEWFNSIGVAAIVLKYRVPSKQGDSRWLSAVQDAERAMSLTRSKSKEWGIAPDRLGILGFSAGGFTAGHLAVQHSKRLYEATDDIDKVPFRPDFGVLVYPGLFIDDKTGDLKPEFTATQETPPIFFVHAADDGLSCANSAQLFLSLKKAKVPGELHIYDVGGHGYGMRPVAEFPVTSWPKRCEDWLSRRGLLKN